MGQFVMADDTTPPATKTSRLIRSKDFRVIFTNNFRIRASTSDIGIAFSYTTELPGDQTIVQDEVELVFTPIMLKVLRLALDDNIEHIEKIIGPIQLPAEFLEAVAAAKAVQQAVTEQAKADKK
jgi:hypothetical protein